jgi:hypothetical protein
MIVLTKGGRPKKVAKGVAAATQFGLQIRESLIPDYARHFPNF